MGSRPQHGQPWLSEASPSAAGTVCHGVTCLPSVSRRNAQHPCFDSVYLQLVSQHTPPMPPSPPSGGHVERRAHGLNLQTEASACCSGALNPGTPATRSGNVAVQPVPVEDGCQSSSTQVGAGPRLKLVLDQCQHSIFDDNQAGMLTAWLAGRLAGGRLKARWTQGSLRVLLKS